MIARVKKNDLVMVISGKEKGKQGKVIEVIPKSSKVLVKGISFATHYVKARRQGEVGGIKRIESYLDLSKVMPVCISCKKPTRINSVVAEPGSCSRICNKCKSIF